MQTRQHHSTEEATPAEVRIRSTGGALVMLLSAAMLAEAYLAGWL